MALSKDPELRKRQLANLRPIKKGTSGNPKGAQRRSLSVIISEMTAAGIPIPKKTEIRDSLILCAFGTEAQIKAIIADKEQPMALRIIARNVLSDKGFEAIERIFDRTIGKMLDVTTNDKDIKPDPLIVQVIDDATQVRHADSTDDTRIPKD